MNATRITAIALMTMICVSAPGKEDAGVEIQPQVLNVVLLELSADPALSKPVINEWTYWEKKAGRLLSRLEKGLGYARCSGQEAVPNASLFAIRAHAGDVSDLRESQAVIDALDSVCANTRRPSMLFVWLPCDGVVLLGLQDSAELQARVALNVLRQAVPKPCPVRIAMATETPYVAPPCVLRAGNPSPTDRQTSGQIGIALDQPTVERFLNCLAVTRYSLVHRSQIVSVGRILSAGAALQKIVIDIPGINDSGAGRPEAWAQTLIGSDSPVRYNIRHEGFTAGDWPKEPGTTIVLPKGWNLQSGSDALAPLLADINAGKPVYVKIDQNIGAAKYFGAPLDLEGRWVSSTANWVAEQGKALNPKSEVYANLHSKGTVDGLHLNWKNFDGGIIASPRNSVNDWLPVLDSHPDTFFTFITGDMDFPHDAIGRGYLSIDRQNSTIINFKSETLNPLNMAKVHGQVTDPTLTGQFDVRSSGEAIQRTYGKLADLVPQSGKMGTKLSGLYDSAPIQGMGEINITPLADINRRLHVDPDLFRNKTGFLPGGPGGGGSGALSTSVPRPGGILFCPELEIVIDKVGLTTAKAEKAVAAVKGDKVGGEFTFEGQKYIAVKAPGTARLFQVQAGSFSLEHMDLMLSSIRNAESGLCRFYDSVSAEKSEIGPGWSFLPFSLRIGPTEDVTGCKFRAARKPVLVDRGTGAELEYELMPLPAEAVAEGTTATVLPQYRKCGSLLQPYLQIESNGTYVARFIHGYQIVFDKGGRLQSVGLSDDRLVYRFEGERLAGIETEGAKIVLSYDAQGVITGAKASDGRSVKYRMDSEDRLVAVTGLESGQWEFGYKQGDRLATVKRGSAGTDDELSIVAENKFDDKGRMVRHRTPQGEWRFAYDDQVGRAVISGPDGKETSYFYDGYQRLVAYGSANDEMTLLNYDVSGRVLQVAKGEMLNNPSGGERPRFKVVEMVTPLPGKAKMKNKAESKKKG